MSVSINDRVTSLSASNAYIPSLDGIRAISILSVLLAHAGFDRVIPGGLGVTIFFVVSGFLITRQLAVESDRLKSINLKNFYLRRFFRLAPALLVYVVLSISILHGLLGVVIPWWETFTAVFYLANYQRIFFDYSPSSPFGILWSLAVEEHYYLIFPAIVLGFSKNLRKIIFPVFVFSMLALLWRIFLYKECKFGGGDWSLCGIQPPNESFSWRQYFGTDTRYDSILFGSLLALISHYWNSNLTKISTGIGALSAACAVIVLTILVRDSFFRDTIRYTIQPIAIAIMLGCIVFGNFSFIRNALSGKYIVYIGRLSYSLYLYHWGVLKVINKSGFSVNWHNAMFYVFFVLSFACAAISYHFVEKPIVRLRKRFGSHAVEQAA